ncbi:elongation of very long chain fatty acids protein 7-like [Oppia nitens]|uniref:elongation of very long chain fatty acids protein 7-like n=1 Tax=Oppia nitens TaxID=1686743 RepID=UPI0023DC1B41|nr:elongation of very long chain fatty acids protein 7-like [Oppia nitens]
MSILDKTIYYLGQYWDDIGDPRVNDWYMLKGGIWKILSIMSIYLLIVRVILPIHMKRRPPYDLAKPILWYNTLMVVFNAYGLYWAVRAIDYGRIFLDFTYPSREDTSEWTMWLMNLGWLWMGTRFLDLMDTVFFVVRKKESQITTLHLYHHTVVPILGWVSFKYNAMIPIIRMFLLLNSFIHVMMYSYYALSSLGPSVQKYLWWKRYITQCQILQFLICGCYGVVLFTLQTGYPMEWFAFCVGQNPLFFYMFYDFYKQSYNRRKLKQ